MENGMQLLGGRGAHHFHPSVLPSSLDPKAGQENTQQDAFSPFGS